MFILQWRTGKIINYTTFIQLNSMQLLKEEEDLYVLIWKHLQDIWLIDKVINSVCSIYHFEKKSQ